MESTITQNSALYFAQHKVSKQLASGDLFIAKRLHHDNGR